MSSSSSSAIERASAQLFARWRAARQWQRLTTILAASSITLLIASFLDGYRRWKLLGAGGLPYNLKGYTIDWIFEWRYGWADCKDLRPYDRPEKYYKAWKEVGDHEREVVARKRFLRGGVLGVRKGPQTKARAGVIPQRERYAHEYSDPEIRQAYLASFEKLVSDRANALEWKTSTLERRGQAVFLRSSRPLRTLDASTRREICHIHQSDLSGHVTLSLEDAREVVAKGWGQRHPLSGQIYLPLGYTMLYIPRSLEEIEVNCSILEAGIEYMASAE